MRDYAQHIFDLIGLKCYMGNSYLVPSTNSIHLCNRSRSILLLVWAYRPHEMDIIYSTKLRKEITNKLSMDSRPPYQINHIKHSLHLTITLNQSMYTNCLCMPVIPGNLHTSCQCMLVIPGNLYTNCQCILVIRHSTGWYTQFMAILTCNICDSLFI